MSLFSDPSRCRRDYSMPRAARAFAGRVHQVPVAAPFRVRVDDRLLDLYARAENPGDAFELRDLYLGRVEAELPYPPLRPELAQRWTKSRVRQRVTAEEVLGSRATVRFVKELFNAYFRDDLYGALQSDDTSILSGGSVDEEAFGLPETLKQCIQYALRRDWYGYSDSRGRLPAREAVAQYESARVGFDAYGSENVALTSGATFALSSLADFLLEGRQGTAPTLCGIPNYPPLVETIARRGPTVRAL